MNQAQLAQIVATVVAVMAAQKKPSASGHKAVSTYKAANKFTPKGKVASDGFTQRQLKNDVAVAKAFKAKGLLITPRVDAMTYNKWLSVGKRVKSGEKGLFVKGVGTLFHSGQVEVAPQPTKAEMTAEVTAMQSFPA